MLRFVDFNDDWQKTTLDGIATFSKGKGISKNDISEEGIECVRYGELYTKYGELIYNIDSKTNLNKNELVLSNKNDILIPCSGETAIDLATASCIQKEQVAIGGDITIIKTNQYAPFITYYLNQKRNEIARFAQGVSIVHLYSKDFKALKMKIPSINEQKKIISLLEVLTNKEQLLEQKYQYYQDFKKYLMQQIFAQKLRFDFKDTWDKVLLKDVAFIPKKTKLTNVEGLKLLTVKLHTKGIEINDRIKPKLTKRGRPYYIRRSGELLIGRQNFHNGGMGIVPKSLDGGICSNAISSFNVFEDKIDVNYLYYFLARPEYYIKSERLIGGTGQKEFSEKELLKLKIDLPSLEEQNKIVDFLLNIDHKIELSENQLNKTQEFKKGLLQQMFDNMLLFKL